MKWVTERRYEKLGSRTTDRWWQARIAWAGRFQSSNKVVAKVGGLEALGWALDYGVGSPRACRSERYSASWQIGLTPAIGSMAGPYVPGMGLAGRGRDCGVVVMLVVG